MVQLRDQVLLVDWPVNMRDMSCRKKFIAANGLSSPEGSDPSGPKLLTAQS